jgi:diacylglycerol O-acyltransferase / wax synthase
VGEQAAQQRVDAAAGEPFAERLTSTDVAFLEMESPTRYMHVGGLFVFEPPAEEQHFSFAAFLELVSSRLHFIPRYRQKVLQPAFGLAGAVWVDDPDFDLSYHVRHAALPGPGTTEQLTEYATRILARQLDRDRPLWELYVIEGLEQGRVALLGKTHHAMIDGLAGIDIATVMFDLAPDASDELPAPSPGTPVRHRPSPPWRAARSVSWSAALPRSPSRSAVWSGPRRQPPARRWRSAGESVGSRVRTCCTRPRGRR